MKATTVTVRCPRGFVTAEKLPTYKIWRGMLQRCFDSNNKGYQYYGGKGIRVAARWLYFPDFLADMGIRPNSLTIDRIDGRKDYEPGNCRWVTMAVNLANRTPQRGRPALPPARTLDDLSARQKEIAHGIREDKTAREIARDLSLSLQTTRGYIKDLMARTQLHSNVAVALWVDRQNHAKCKG